MADMPYRERFLHIGFYWKGVPKVEELEPLFNTALDWYRYAPNCWVVWTNNNAGVWYSHIAKHITQGDRVLVAELDLDSVPENYTGWASKSFWEWIDKHRK